MSTLRDQSYFAGGALLDVGFADTRGILRDTPQGDSLFEITPQGQSRQLLHRRSDRHFYRQQWIANLFLPTLHWQGSHHLKFGIDFEREAFHQQVMRHDYAVLRDDNSLARYVTFTGSPFRGAQELRRRAIRSGLLEPARRSAGRGGAARGVERDRARSGSGAADGRGLGAEAAAGHEVLGRLGRVLRLHQSRHHLAPAGPDQPRDFLLAGGRRDGPVTTSFLVNERSLRTP